MRVCPKCGYVEYEYWRQNRWRTNVEFTKPEEFQHNTPDLYQQLMNGVPTVFDKNYAYRFCGKKKRVVERVWLVEYQVDPKHAFSIPREHKDHVMDLKQRRLLEAMKP